MAPTIALYIHFPFCLSICPYCDFDRQATGFDRIDAYLALVAREIQSYDGRAEPVHSVFFGGGTPSLMRPDQVASLLRTARDSLGVLPGAEITLECNPGDADPCKMEGFRKAGVTRLSFGVQSLDDQELALVGRRHSAAEARQAARWAREAGFFFNLDFIYGLPGQTPSRWQATLEDALSLAPDHLSCYALTLEEKVPMAHEVARGRLRLPPEDDVVGQYQHARVRLAEAGYEQYEISNWARPGQASVHNLTYWRDGAWIGVGAGAASSWLGRRWKNTPVLERYITSMERSGQALRMEDERPDRATNLLDHLALGLRLREGIDPVVFRQRFGLDLPLVLGEQGCWLVEAGFLAWRAGRLIVPDEHQLLTGEILARLAEPVQSFGRRSEAPLG